MDPPVEIVAGRYRLLSLIGQGGMGSVWRGEHTSLGTPVAIKLIDPRLAQKETVRARFLREARAAAALRSRHVVQVLDHGVEGDIPFIVMELLRGESLGDRLRREPPLEIAEIARIFVEMGRAIGRAHAAGVIHRDLKPDNVFLAQVEDEGGYVVKVVDFGIAKLTDDGRLADDVSTETGAMIGTPHYMSPEQARSVKSLDARADLWSMGVIAFECVTRQRPFRAESLGDLIFLICAEAPPVPSTVAPVPDGFDAWFDKATRKKPEDRFQTVAELMSALEDVLTPGKRTADAPSSSVPTPTGRGADVEHEPTLLDERSVRTGDPSTTSTPPPTAPSGRGRLVVGVGAALVLGVAALVGLGRFRDGGAPLPTTSVPGSGALPSAAPTAAETPADATTGAPSATASPGPSTALQATPSASAATSGPSGLASTSPGHPKRAPATRPSGAPSGSAVARPPARPGCEEPFTIGPAGDLIPRAECF